MGFIALGGKIPSLGEDDTTLARDRRLRASQPHDLLSGPRAGRPIALAQAYLAAGAAVTGTLAAVFPHPAYFDVTGLLAVQAAAALWAVFMFALRGPSAVLGAAPRPGARHGDDHRRRATSAATAPAATRSSTSGWVSTSSTSRCRRPTPPSTWSGLHRTTRSRSRSRPRRRGRGRCASPLRDHGRHADHRRRPCSPICVAASSGFSSRLTDAARTDPLTGLAEPRRAARGPRARDRARRARAAPVSLLILDLDRFKRINERLRSIRRATTCSGGSRR